MLIISKDVTKPLSKKKNKPVMITLQRCGNGGRLRGRVKYLNEGDIVGIFTAKDAISDHQIILLHEIEGNTEYKSINANAESWGKNSYKCHV